VTPVVLCVCFSDSWFNCGNVMLFVMCMK
jgi:hypothetical protein